jgi:RNA polymerase sigma factor (sigma-70 family)
MVSGSPVFLKLNDLQRGDEDAWTAVVEWLWPIAIGVAKFKLHSSLQAEAEDVAIESLSELPPKILQVGSTDDLKPLLASIAANKAISFQRERFAQKRGGGKVGSLEESCDHDGRNELPEAVSVLSCLEVAELKSLLKVVLQELPPIQNAVLDCFYIQGLKYVEISQKLGMPINSVGVNLKRSLEAIQTKVGKKHKLSKELSVFLRCILCL